MCTHHTIIQYLLLNKQNYLKVIETDVDRKYRLQFASVFMFSKIVIGLYQVELERVVSKDE